MIAAALRDPESGMSLTRNTAECVVLRTLRRWLRDGVRKPRVAFYRYKTDFISLVPLNDGPNLSRRYTLRGLSIAGAAEDDMTFND